MADDGRDLGDAVESFASSIERALGELRADLPAPPPPSADPPAAPIEPLRPVASAPEPAADAPRRERRRRRRRGERIGRRAVVVLTAIAVPLALVVSVGPLLLPYRTYHVRSGSMEPAIPTGALVVLAEVDAEEIEVGDVITFDRPDGATGRVTHRVVDVVGDGGGRAFLTKGDANDVPDPWRVPAAGTQLRHVFDVPLLGYLFGWLSSAAARAGLLAVPAVALAWLTWTGRRRRTPDAGA